MPAAFGPRSAWNPLAFQVGTSEAGIAGSPITAADLLDQMMVLDNELEAGDGEAEELSCLRALTMAQRYLEMVAATMPHTMQTAKEFTATSLRESDIPPTGLLRLDRIVRLSAVGGSQVGELGSLGRTGGHASGGTMPWSVALVAATPGPPAGYWYHGDRIYWQPPPDQLYPMRAYGLFRGNTFTSRTSPFIRSDEIGLGVSAMAVRLLSIGVDDESQDLMGLAVQIFRPLLRSVRKTDRSAPMGRVYTEHHTT